MENTKMPRNVPAAIKHRDEILQRLAAGEYLNNIAKSLGVTGPALSQVLANDPEYHKAREHGTAERLDYYIGEMENSEDMLTLARARECFKAKSWLAEREFRRWSPKQEVTNNNVSIDINELLQSRMKRIETTHTIESIETNTEE